MIESLATKIPEMRAEQQRPRDVRMRQAAALKDLQRRKRRLKGKARQLSNEFLLAVLLVRQRGSIQASAPAAGLLEAPEHLLPKTPECALTSADFS